MATVVRCEILGDMCVLPLVPVMHANYFRCVLPYGCRLANEFVQYLRENEIKASSLGNCVTCGWRCLNETCFSVPYRDLWKAVPLIGQVVQQQKMGSVPAAEFTVEHNGQFYPFVWDLQKNVIIDFCDGIGAEVMTFSDPVRGDMFAWLELVCSLL